MTDLAKGNAATPLRPVTGTIVAPLHLRLDLHASRTEPAATTGAADALETLANGDRLAALAAALSSLLDLTAYGEPQAAAAALGAALTLCRRIAVVRLEGVTGL